MQKTDKLLLAVLKRLRHVGVPFDILCLNMKLRDRNFVDNEEHYPAALHRLRESGKAIEVEGKWFMAPTESKGTKGRGVAPEWSKPMDGLVFLACVFLRNRKARGLAEMLVHAVSLYRCDPKRLEVFEALNRLAAGGLIKVEDGQLNVTKKGLRYYAKVEGVRDLWEQIERMGRILDCPCCGVNLQEVHWNIPIKLTEWKDALRKAHRALGFDKD